MSNTLTKIGISQSNVIPYMTPEQIDNFVNWIRARVDWTSFLQSSQEYKERQVKTFFKENPEQTQLSMF